MKVTIRHDDFDFRMYLEYYQSIHEQFMEADLIETAVLQFAQGGKLIGFEEKKDIIDYMNSTPNWDFQLHGWSHHVHPRIMDLNDAARDLAACVFFCKKLFKKTPTVWYPQWNEKTPITEKAAKLVGLKIDTETIDIERFILDANDGKFKYKSVYFHGWRKPEYDMIPKMIKWIKEGYEN